MQLCDVSSPVPPGTSDLHCFVKSVAMQTGARPFLFILSVTVSMYCGYWGSQLKGTHVEIGLYYFFSFFLFSCVMEIHLIKKNITLRNGSIASKKVKMANCAGKCCSSCKTFIASLVQFLLRACLLSCWPDRGKRWVKFDLLFSQTS